MSDLFVVAVENLNQEIDRFENLPDDVRRYASQAINRTADWTRTRSERAIREQVNFPAGYLSPSQGRLTVSRRASPRNLEAQITARFRATSLARFALPGTTRGKGVSVAVKPGVAKFMRRAFLMKLRGAGGELTNMGLAVRTSGGPPKGAYKPYRLSDNLYLVYGPSIDQVFRHVREDLTPESLDYLQNEFDRLSAARVS